MENEQIKSFDGSSRSKKASVWLKANPISKLFFCFLSPLFNKGLTEHLEVSDLHDILPEDAAQNLSEKLEKEWNKELRSASEDGQSLPSLRRAMFRCFGRQSMLLGLLLLMEEAVKVVQPLLLGGLVRYFAVGGSVPKSEAYLYAMGISLCALWLSIARHPYMYALQHLGMQLRIACCAVLYKKSLRICNSVLSYTPPAEILGLLTSEINKFDQAIIFFHYLWVGPLEALAIVILLYWYIGPASFAGCGVLVVLPFMQNLMGKCFTQLRQKTAVYTQERLMIIVELIRNIRGVKMYCWERMFTHLIGKARRKEMAHMKMTSVLRALNMAASFISARLVIYLSVLIYALLGNKMDAERVFVVVALFNVLRLVMTFFLPFSVQQVRDSRDIIKKLENFLLLEELTSRPLQTSSLHRCPHDRCIAIKDLTASWDKSSKSPTLNMITCTVGSDELMAIVGPPGAGKTSLLMAVVGELEASRGTVAVHGRLAFVSQQPFIFHATVRQNITMGSAFESEKYEKVVRACALKRDIDLLPHGDLTVIGQSCTELQKAKINLARAVYYNADVYLLDEPLAPFDAETARFLFERCINGLLGGKCRFMVTSDIQLLKFTSRVMILKEGEVIGIGSHNQLRTAGVNFTSVLEDEDEDLILLPVALPTSKYSSICSSQAGSILSLRTFAAVGSTDVETQPEMLQTSFPVMEEEEDGEYEDDESEGFSTYQGYFTAGGGILVFILLLFFNIVAQGAATFSDVWLAFWCDSNEAEEFALNGTRPFAQGFGLNENIYVYSGIVGTLAVFGLLRALLFFHVSMLAACNLHSTVFGKILKAPLCFFMLNPLSSLISRFTRDGVILDDLLPFTLYDFFECFLQVLGCLVVVAVFLPWTLIAMAALIITFFLLRIYYLQTAKDIKYLETITRRPVYNYLSSSLMGLPTIHVYNNQDYFTQLLYCHQDLHSSAWWLFLVTSRWFAIRLDMVCTMLVTIVSFCTIFTADSQSAGSVGLTVTYAIALFSYFQWMVRQSAELESQMASVQRMLTFQSIPSEAPWENESEKPPCYWPQHGIVTFEGVYFSYSPDGARTLRNVFACIRAKEKVGVVGQSISGKDSIPAVLFRLAEPKGTVRFDGVDISHLGLHDFRRKVSIIPADPVMFSCSVRMNLDPFQDHTDADLWDVLEEVQLKQALEELPQRLDTVLFNSGAYFSTGQKHLFSLARAILKSNRILIIEEPLPTNIDYRTDMVIQQVVRQKFQHCTVITIANRLSGIMDSDRVMVLVDGRIREFDEPFTLLQDDSSLFYKMVETSGGRRETEQLLDIARQAYLVRNAPDVTKGSSMYNQRSAMVGMGPCVSIGSDDLDIDDGNCETMV
ncbi:PREDICTED: multidrug resistance-associated protein 4-like [Priapulus caudatus]|uniref:Multidrug resistance-associated protein 4-like n=1 Tax=Priapulus caudatus TaxID=37621 RepID=A0ABM1EBM3_PRICU|nr:PREDICTED: multidrug resistance-associated protein 4-like [Priapulus caudatus]